MDTPKNKMEAKLIFEEKQKVLNSRVGTPAISGNTGEMLKNAVTNKMETKSAARKKLLSNSRVGTPATHQRSIGGVPTITSNNNSREALLSRQSQTVTYNPPVESNRQQSSSVQNTKSDISMKAVKLQIEPFRFISILGWECVQELGEHGVLRVTGLISEENEQIYQNMPTDEVWICAKATDGNDQEITLFHGVLTNLAIQSQSKVHKLTIEAKTGSFLLDKSVHTRTFQSDSFTYESVLDTCLESENGQVLMRHKNTAQINHFLVQYKETNWQFAKRLAWQLDLPILPEFNTKGKKFYIGLDDTLSAKELVADSYTFKKTALDQESIAWIEMGVYKVQSRRIYKLSEPVLFKGIKLLIGKVESRLEREELCHEYTLFLLKSKFQTQQLNHKVSGVSLRASVTRVEKDKVQVSIHDDANKQHCGSRWFDYATVYSTPDGTGWYAMPEVGDEARIVFPEADESKAYVVSSVHLDTSRGRINPDHKSWKNKQHKEILFTPEKLVLTNNNGISIELSDAKGINISSNKAITIQSGGQINMNSQDSGISLYANKSLVAQQGAAQICVKDAIDISGGKINMN